MLNIHDKLEFIKKIVQDNGRIYVEIDSSIAVCVYDLYTIILNSGVETVINKISNYMNVPLDNQSLSTVCLYIGCFCDITFGQSVTKNKIVTSYYKISSGFGNGFAMNNLGRYYRDMGKYDTAIKYFQKAIESKHVKINPTYLKIARCYSKKGDYDEAIKYYKLEKEFERTWASIKYSGIANCYYDKGDYNFAIKYYQKDLLICNKTDKNTLYNNIGCCYHNKKDYSNTIKYYEKCLEDDGEAVPIRCKSIAHLYLENKNYDKSIEYYEKYLEGPSEDKAEIYNTIAQIYVIKSQPSHSAALTYFKLAYNCGKCSAVCDIGITYQQMKVYNKAMKYFKKSVVLLKEGRILPDNIKDAYEVTLLYYNQRDELLAFYMIKKYSSKIISLLSNKVDHCDIQSETLAEVATYFSSSENTKSLHTFVRNVIRPKLELLDLHFKYAINSSGYEQAEENFNKCLSNTKNDSLKSSSNTTLMVV